MRRDIYRKAVEQFPDHLPLPFDAIYTDHGFDALYDVSILLGGETVYIPMPKGLFKDCVARTIEQEYNGFNALELSKKYRVSERYVQRLVKK